MQRPTIKTTGTVTAMSRDGTRADGLEVLESVVASGRHWQGTMVIRCDPHFGHVPLLRGHRSKILLGMARAMMLRIRYPATAIGHMMRSTRTRTESQRACSVLVMMYSMYSMYSMYRIKGLEGTKSAVVWYLVNGTMIME